MSILRLKVPIDFLPTEFVQMLLVVKHGLTKKIQLHGIGK